MREYVQTNDLQAHGLQDIHGLRKCHSSNSVAVSRIQRCDRVLANDVLFLLPDPNPNPLAAQLQA